MIRTALRSIAIFLLFLALAFSGTAEENTAIVQFQAYVTAHQVDQYFSTPEDREKTLQVYQNLGISKVYLESHRSGHKPGLALLREARDFLQNHGIAVACGITTTAGESFGFPSSSSSYWMNYQHPKTQTDVAAHMREIAPLFDEIIVDDFLATDDESPMSQEVKGNRSWSEYRLELMADFAQRFIIQPAREANPAIQLIEKFPQWYDRFHIFGYHATAAPGMFDRIWVGTETRNPDTKRFGFVMPTEGYINYSWLKSIAREKIGGAWFDFGDCTPGSFLMQAYQSVLAGARELVVFETGSLIAENECLQPFQQRRDALIALGKIVAGRSPLGMYAYKPPHSTGSDENGAANLYIYDYLATLGLAPIPVAQVPADAKCVFLPRQAADDPEIAAKFQDWLKKNIKLIVTPDFVAQAKEIPIPSLPDRNSLLPFSSRQIDTKTIWIFNLETFRHEEFAPDKEMFLPPRPLPVREWPKEIVNPIRKEILSLFGLELDAPNNVGAYLFDNGLLVLANFNDSPAQCIAKIRKADGKPYRACDRFPHDGNTRFEAEENEYTVTLSPWEIAVLQR